MTKNNNVCVGQVFFIEHLTNKYVVYLENQTKQQDFKVELEKPDANIKIGDYVIAINDKNSHFWELFKIEDLI